MSSDNPYPCLVAFVEGVVLPRLLEHPGRTRLDGWDTGGNWEVAGRFLHDGDTWKAHEDCHFEPLLLAYWNLKFHPGRPALVRAETKRGERLDLVPELRSLHHEPHRYLYLYLET